MFRIDLLVFLLLIKINLGFWLPDFDFAKQSRDVGVGTVQKAFSELFSSIVEVDYTSSESVDLEDLELTISIGPSASKSTTTTTEEPTTTKKKKKKP